jgi:carbonic anhydrase
MIRPMSAIDDLLDANRRYAERHESAGLPAPPSRRVAVLTCMDARLDPARMLGLQAGDAHVIRNAGGRVGDALRSLVISQRLLGTTEVMVIHHRDCGMLGLRNEDVRERVRRELGADDGGIDYLPFADAEGGVRDDLALLRSSPLVGDDVTVRGFLYDEASGRLEEVS